MSKDPKTGNPLHGSTWQGVILLGTENFKAWQDSIISKVEEIDLIESIEKKTKDLVKDHMKRFEKNLKNQAPEIKNQKLKFIPKTLKKNIINESSDENFNIVYLNEEIDI